MDRPPTSPEARTVLPSGFGAGDLFQLLRDGQARTRSELATRTGFARSTVTARIDELIALDLVEPVAAAQSTGGRPSARVALNPDARLVAAADFGATHAVIGLANLAGDLLIERSHAREIADGPITTLDWLSWAIQGLLKEIDRDSSDLIAIGIGLPGPVEHTTGRPTSPPIMPGWDAYDVPAHVNRFFSVPVLVDNDVNVMALGEQSKAWRDVRDLLFIKVATGIGSGIISGGRLQRGADGSAGDIGHVATPSASGVVCRCGNTGCLEAIAGVGGIAHRFARAGLEVSTATEMIALEKSGDPQALQVMRQVGRDIGQVVSTCVSVVNPSVVVVGGVLSASEVLVAGLREVVYSRSMPLATRNLTIATTRIGHQAGVIGAGMLALDHALSAGHVTMLSRRREHPINSVAPRP